MRNTTKLKTLLLKYSITFNMADNGQFIMLLTDKATGNMQRFEGESYSRVLALAYSYLLRMLKDKPED